MISRTALILSLGAAMSSAAYAETYSNPDPRWWGRFFNAVEGQQPDFEVIAKKDPAYIAASEFDRDEVLTRLVAELKQQQGNIDTATAEITVTISATLGDYSAQAEGFPSSLFVPNMHLPIGVQKLFFRNFEDFRIFPATRDQGKALRERIGTRALTADVTLTNIQASTTRPRAFEGYVSKVIYTAADGLVVGEFTAREAAPLPASAAADQVPTTRSKILEMAGIPQLGTPWADAKAIIQSSYPYSASDTFIYTDKGKVIAYQHDNGITVLDAPHEADKAFRIYLQQAEGNWRTTRGFSVDLIAGNAVSVRGTGPGLACYTPDILDRCGMLEFSPADGGHILTRAYGIIELERSGSPRDVVEAFVGDSIAAFDGFGAQVDYDADTLKTGVLANYPGIRGVPAYVMGAGEIREGAPLYDPLQNTTGLNPITREVALFAIDGAPDRIPLLFVLQ